MIPTGIPLVYRLGLDLRPIEHRYLAAEVFDACGPMDRGTPYRHAG
jgi:hypothetical protein